MIKRYSLFFLIALFIHSLFYFFPTQDIKKDELQEKNNKPKINTFRMVDLPVQKPETVNIPKKTHIPPKKNKESIVEQKSDKPQIQADENTQPTESSQQPQVITETNNSPAVSDNEEIFFHAAEVSVLPSLPARLLQQRLHYPQEARRRGIEGIVYLQLYINSKGIVEKVEILREKPNSSYGFGAAAKNALLGIKGTPAKHNGKAVGVIFRYPVRFTLEK